MFWTIDIDAGKKCVIKIKNPIHITLADIVYHSIPAPSSVPVSLYIRHQGQLHKSCTFSKSLDNLVHLDLKLDGKDDEVEFFLDGPYFFTISGSETPSHISHLSVATIRDLESNDLMDIPSCSENVLKRKATDSIAAKNKKPK